MQNQESRKCRFRRRLFLLALNLAVVGALLLAGELYMRRRESYIIRQEAETLRQQAVIESDPELLVTYTPKGKRLLPNAHVVIKNHRLSGRDIKMDTNSLGFRDREIPAEKRRGEIRVLVLGDSITVADYLPVEETWVERTEYHLQLRTGKKMEVINAGIGDVGLAEELDLLEEKGLQVQPDVVVVGFFLNDSRPGWGFPGELGHYGFLRRHSVLAQKVYEQLVLLKWVREKGAARLRWPILADKLAWRSDPKIFFQFVKLAEFDWGAAWEEDSWKLVGRELDRLRALATTHHFQTVILFFPVKYQVYAHYVEDSPQKQMENMAAARGFFYLDLLPLLRAHAGEDLFFDHCHLKPAANDYVGKALADFLGQKVLSSQSQR